MSAEEEHTTESARAAAARDDLAGWVGRFLASPGSDNAALAEQLEEAPLEWIGPVQVPLDQLCRLAGPPGAPVLQEVADHEWRDDVDDLARSVEDGHEPPPVVVTHRADDEGQLVVEDGNHRIEALRRAGVDRAWAVIGFVDAATRDRFIARADAG